MSRAWAGGVLVAGLAVGLLSCGGGSGARPDGAAELFARRSRAVLARDEAAFLATAAPELRAQQQQLWDGLSSVSFSHYEIVAGEIRWQITGFDGPPAVDRVRYLTARRSGELVITGDDGVADHELWDDGPVTTTTGAHLTVVAARARPDLVDAAEAAYAQVAAAIGIPMPERVLVLVPRSDDELRGLLGGALGADVSGFTAFTVAGTGPSAPVGEGQPRVVVRDGPLVPRPDTLVHELVHAAAYPVAARAPVWLHEGLAEWVAHGRRPPATVVGSDGRLPTDAELAGPAPQVSYGEAESAVAFLAAERGPDAPWRLLARVGAGASADTALAEVWGGDQGAFETVWASEVGH